MTTHPIIDRLADLVASMRSEELTIDDVSHALRKKRSYVEALVRDDKLESWRESARSGKRRDSMGRPVQHRYTISAAAVLIYLCKSTGGSKTVILHAIAQRFPHHHALCAGPVVAPADNATPVPIALPKAVRKKREHKDPYKGHPDLFNA